MAVKKYRKKQKSLSRYVRWTMAIVVLAVALILVITYIVQPSSITPSPKNTISRPLSPPSTPAVHCSAPGASFCQTQNLFVHYVGMNDFSDILEHQVATPITCGAAADSTGVCSGISDKLAIQTFKVSQNGIVTYMTRNDYINYFLTYAQQYGPFHMSGDTGDSSDITMDFVNASATKVLDFTFHHVSSGWQFIFPST
ncbi:MAG TPA: hypothetical protein VGS28_03470 [Candidatus Saccharimonadales bacterium]|nr:hypothetical protein [Candidatus Saccharimonadales bacterium]